MSSGGSILIVHCSDDDINHPAPNTTCYLYRIGTGTVSGTRTVELNDSIGLHNVADRVRDSYVEWINAFNALYLESGLVNDGLSLFMLSDVSCKRTELFETFNVVCNCLRDETVSEVWIYGANRRLISAIRSIFPTAKLKSELEKGVNSQIRNDCSTALYFLRLFGVATINLLCRREKTDYPGLRGAPAFFTIMPKMSDDGGKDRKYGSKIREGDTLLGTIIADGLHQKFRLTKYLMIRRRMMHPNLVLIDDHIRVSDCLFGLYWWSRLTWFRLSIKKKRFVYEGIDLSGYIRSEVYSSGDRICRLVALGRGLDRALSKSKPTKFVYYLHEYSIGRMISAVVHNKHPQILTYGFQHGPASWRKLVYFLGSLANGGDCLTKAPIPANVLAETAQAKKIYEYSGYSNVAVMTDVSRLDYLNQVDRQEVRGLFLLAPGLHDGERFLKYLGNWLNGQDDKQFLYKPHPLASREYLRQLERVHNVVLTERPVLELLSIVQAVFVTYSSIGLEAVHVGVPVIVVNIPGMINETPLIGPSSSLMGGVYDFCKLADMKHIVS